jgi:plasmid stability protein
MAQLVVRNLEDDVKERLRQRAKRHRQSMEEEVRMILRAAAYEAEDQPGLGTQFARLFEGVGLDFEIPELRGEQVRIVTFDEE